MSITIDLHNVETLTKLYGPLRTVLDHTGNTDVAAELDDVYSLEVLGGKTLRESVINSTTGPVLIIRAVEYIDPVERTTRYAVEAWNVTGFRTVDHDVRLVIESEYERQVCAEFARPTLPVGRARFVGGMATFYDSTDLI
ncbi:hypothetical protein GTY65_24475 [Streptomyces sp. SID8379]|uniref:hypothetical protein n=1 Tax=unclassified Streptomyces TaxID=2593676 RepID=UPI000367D872|nr:MULTISPECIES: hypothetical protein [unclassified Streptomyces]MYW67199.1 hypothetical protein [Streptomyces sp. SID8379]